MSNDVRRDPEHRTVDALSARTSAADCHGPGSPMTLNSCPDNESRLIRLDLASLPRAGQTRWPVTAGRHRM